MRVIAVINQKGGVAKTTTTANLGHALAREGHRVTLLDLDPQGHLATYLGVRERHHLGIAQVLLGKSSTDEVLINVRDNVSLIPAGEGLDHIEQAVDNKLEMSKRLKMALCTQGADSDYLLIDCPPSSSLLIVFALYCSDEVLVPVNGDYLSLQGVSHFLMTLRNVERALGRELKLQLVMTRYYPKRRLARSIVGKLLEYFPGKVLATPIREVAAMAEAPGFGQTIFEYAPGSYGSQDYQSLASDLELGRVM